MFNLFDIMRQAQGGAAIDNMARQFGLSADQAQRAMEALLPAFAMGLQRSAQNPNALAQLFSLMGSGRHASFFDQPMNAFSGEALAQGNDILARLFGSKDVSRQVAQQAAAMSGIGADIVQRMLPVVAATLSGGLFRSAMSQGPAVLERMAEMLRQAQGGAPQAAPAPQPQAAGQATGNPWLDMMAGMFPPGQQASARPTGGGAPGQQPANPFEAMMREMLQGFGAVSRPAATPPRPEPAPTPNPYEAWGQMFQTGREVQQQHLTSLQNIFDSFWGAGPNRR